MLVIFDFAVGVFFHPKIAGTDLHLLSPGAKAAFGAPATPKAQEVYHIMNVLYDTSAGAAPYWPGPGAVCPHCPPPPRAFVFDEV